MSNQSRTRAVQNYRRRLNDVGLRRYEVVGLPEDQQLIRALAKHLARNDADAVGLRSELNARTRASKPRKGGLLAALRRSPLVGLDLDVGREMVDGRDIAL